MIDKDVVGEFWRARADRGTTRWTGDGMLETDVALASRFVGPGARILDLGSGFGELSRTICPPDGEVLAVDAVAGMSAGFEGDERFAFVAHDVLGFRTDRRFDIVLLFGVVNYLEIDEVERIAQTISEVLVPGGVAIVKNQCADGEAFEVDVDFQGSGQRYVAWYPDVATEKHALMAAFPSVEVVPYPPELKAHDNSTHVAFICRKPS
ncbi:MAG: class I SAM-dependent methyltransferase [Protaetiibacter sp.]